MNAICTRSWEGRKGPGIDRATRMGRPQRGQSCGDRLVSMHHLIAPERLQSCISNVTVLPGGPHVSFAAAVRLDRSVRHQAVENRHTD
jgi:hypothetical protein